MTTKASREAKRTTTVQTGKKFTLSKKTVADLTPGKRQAGAIRGGGAKSAFCGGPD